MSFLKDCDYLNSIENLIIKKHYNLRNLNTLKLDSFGDLYTVLSLNALSELVVFFKTRNISYFVLGNGSNLVLDKEVKGPIIKLDFPLNQSVFNDIEDEYCLPASILLKKLTSIALKYHLSGWEVFTGVPATLGGAIFMNAGTGLGEIGDLVTNVQVVNSNGEVKNYNKEYLKFSYRKNLFLNNGDIICYITLSHKGIDLHVNDIIRNYLQMRSQNQPLSLSSAGCTFKNERTMNYSAGKFIDLLGLKGLQYKGLAISSVHGNFIVNNSFACKEDFAKLLEIIDCEMKSTFGFEFEKEVIL